MNNEYTKQRNDILASLASHRLSSALRKLADLSSSYRFERVTAETKALSEDYSRMLSYMMTGGEDPERNRLYDRMVARAYGLLDRLTRRVESTDSGSLYYSVFRFEATRPDDNVANLVDRYFKVTDAGSLFNLISSESDTDSDRKRRDNLIEREAIERRLFNRLWVTFPLSADNSAAVTRMLEGEEIPVYVKQFVIWSLLLGSLEFFDEERLRLLLDVYIRNAADLKSPLAPAALIAVMLILFSYPTRPIGDAVTVKLEQAASLSSFRNDLKTVYTELVRTRDTERINRKMTDEVIPRLLKLRPDLAKRRIDLSQISDISDLEENPEWMDMLKDSGIADRIKEMSEIQEEGGDVFMSTFAHLKGFPFFTEMHNWFMPFHIDNPTVSAVIDNSEAMRPIAQTLAVTPFLCNSDKYSFFLSIDKVPEAQRTMMLSQYKQFDVNAIEMMSAEANADDATRRNIINKQIQDLYRFYYLYGRKSEFRNPFGIRMNIFGIPGLRRYFSDTDTAMAVAEFYFRHKYYGEALEMFRSIEQNLPPDPSLYQKIGFCLQKSGDIEEALEYYQRAELLDGRSLWTLRRIAACLALNGRFNEALDYYNRILEKEPENESAAADKALTLIELRRYDDAVPLLQKAIYLNPSNHRATRSLARCRMMTGKFKEAAKLLRKLVTDAPLASDYLNLGHIAVARGDFREAVSCYRLAIDTSGAPASETIDRIIRDIPDLESLGVDISVMPFVIDSIDL